MKLTKATVEAAKAPIDKDQLFYRDTQLKGFALRVTARGVKSFVVETTIGNKVKRITLGRFGVLTVETARLEAKKILGDIAKGIDPIAQQKLAKAKSVTLEQVFQDYLQARKNLKPLTIKDYQRLMNEAFGPWLKKPLLDITKDMISKKHTQLGQRSHARANLAMRLLRALFNFSMGQYEDTQGRSLIIENPVKRLSQTRSWYRVERRQNFIKSYELKPWYEAVMTLENHTLRDYLLLLIFTGLRRQEALTLTWPQIDLTGKTLTIHHTKNHEKHTLPLSDFLYELLKFRFENRTSDYVFPGSGKEGYIVEPRKQMQKVIDASGISFTLHDLRRTFTTIAEGLDISAYAVKRLVNHKMTHDVTSGYIVFDVERLRKPMQQITDHLCKQMGMLQSAKILSIPTTDKGVQHEQSATTSFSTTTA